MAIWGGGPDLGGNTTDEVDHIWEKCTHLYPPPSTTPFGRHDSVYIDEVLIARTPRPQQLLTFLWSALKSDYSGDDLPVL